MKLLLIIINETLLFLNKKIYLTKCIIVTKMIAHILPYKNLRSLSLCGMAIIHIILRKCNLDL